MEYVYLEMIDSTSYTMIEQYDEMPKLYRDEIKDENLLSEEELKEIGIYSVEENLPSNYDPFQMDLNIKDFKEWSFDSINRVVLKEYDIHNYTFQEKLDALIIHLANKRYEKETQGIIINGNNIATDRSSQAMLNSAARVLELDPTKTINWKCENGWISLDSTSVTVISQCVIDYVEKCFDNEMSIWNELNSVSDEDWITLQNVDLDSGWPDNNYNV